MLLLTDAKKRLGCTDSPWTLQNLHVLLLTDANVWTVPNLQFSFVAAHRCKETLILHRHSAKFMCDAAHRCKETSRLYRFTMDAAKFTCVAAHRCKETSGLCRVSNFHLLLHRCKETSRLYKFSIGTARNLCVMLLTDAKKRLDCTDLP